MCPAPHESVNSKVYGKGQMPLTESEAILGRLKRACKATSDEQLAAALGLNRQAVTGARKRNSVPSSWLVTIGEQSGVSLDWLCYGGGKMYRDPLIAGEPGDVGAGCLNPDDFILLPMLESRVTAGPEGELLFEDVADHLPFKRWWVEKLVGKSAERLKALILVRVRGDSMIPTINANEVALVDTFEAERIEIQDGRIYLVMLPDGTVAMKRLVLKREGENIRLLCLSDNTGAYHPFEFELAPGKRLQRHVLGRVRWAGKEFE